MTLEKTLINLRKTHLGFFNISDGYINLDLFKPGLVCKYKNYGTFDNTYALEKCRFEISSIGCIRFPVGFDYLYIFKDIINEELKEKYRTYFRQLYIGDFNKIYEVR